jgi:hypothetical protein
MATKPKLICTPPLNEFVRICSIEIGSESWMRDTVAPALMLGYDVTVNIDQAYIDSQFSCLWEFMQWISNRNSDLQNFPPSVYINVHAPLPPEDIQKILSKYTRIKIYEKPMRSNALVFVVDALKSLKTKPWWEKGLLINQAKYNKKNNTPVFSSEEKDQIIHALLSKTYPSALNTPESLPIWFQVYEQINPGAVDMEKPWYKELTLHVTTLLNKTNNYVFYRDGSDVKYLRSESTDSIFWRWSLRDPEIACAWLDNAIRKGTDYLYNSEIPTVAPAVLEYYSQFIETKGSILDAQIPERWLYVSMGLGILPEVTLNCYAKLMIAHRKRQIQRDVQNTLSDSESSIAYVNQIEKANLDIKAWSLAWKDAAFFTNMNVLRTSPAIKAYAIDRILYNDEKTLTWILNTVFKTSNQDPSPLERNLENVVLKCLYPDSLEAVKAALETCRSIGYTPSVEEFEKLLENTNAIKVQHTHHNTLAPLPEILW